MLSSQEQNPGQRLRQERLKQNWSQERLAEALGTTAMTIRRWEHNMVSPQGRFREQLCQLFHCSNEDLFGLSGNAQGETSPQALLWTVPFPRNPCFTGRKELLATLHTRLAFTEPVRPTQTVALTGLGGIGKTQVATEYAYRHILRQHYFFFAGNSLWFCSSP